jgi:hypothetical protein
MATKIEGWATKNEAYPGNHYAFSDLASCRGIKATLVIGDQRVFTEAEVDRMMRSLLYDLEQHVRREEKVEVITAKDIRRQFRVRGINPDNPT